TEFSLNENKLPTKEDLDEVAPDIPVFISSIEFHTLTVNSFALHKLELPLTIDKIIKNSNGIPTGQLLDEASILARRKMYEMLSEEEQNKNLLKVQNRILSKGVTSLIAIEGGYLFHNKHVDYLLNNKEKFKFDISILFSTTNIEKVKTYDFNKIGGDIFFDGSFRSHNASISKHYNDDKNEYGKLFFTIEEMEEFVDKSIKENLQVSIHAVGDFGIEKILDVYEKVLLKYPNKDLRHKIEHFELPKDSHIKRAKKLNLILSMHPTYEYFFREDGGMYEKRLGKERALKTNPFRKIFDKKIIVTGGSDSDVMPIDPLLGIHAAVNHPNVNSRIEPYEALMMYTKNAAFGNFEEKSKGTIEEGKIADIVILSNNPLTINHNKLKDIEVLYTIKNGEIVFEKGE
ncbi:MAG: amidohydrolase, partial [Bacillota bacterium]|nr:amidohydrolase [Bacillota bacterium]